MEGSQLNEEKEKSNSQTFRTRK